MPLLKPKNRALIKKKPQSFEGGIPYGKVLIPPKLKPVFKDPLGEVRYRAAFGGRGSAKSASFAAKIAQYGALQPLRLLCTREVQNTLKDSVHAEIIAAIERHPWMMPLYDWGESYIRGVGPHNKGTEFIFKGLKHNTREIKSIRGIDICWVEEAETVSNLSWQTLVPTIRSEGSDMSEIWLTWNPESEDSATRKRFILNEQPLINIVKLNWQDNPWFPPELELERQACLKNDPDNYDWIWEGDTRVISDAQILNGKWVVQDFTPQDTWQGPYHGADFGFANDPSAAVRVWIGDNRLWVEYESYKRKLELDSTSRQWIKDVPGIEKYVLRADCARPESISYLRRKGLPKIIACKKWSGCIEDRIEYLKSFEKIVIHPRCKWTIYEAKHYQYKVDRDTQDPLPIIIDANNHIIDSIAYALGPLIQNKFNKSGYGRSYW